MKFCPNCGADNSDDALNCVECNAPLMSRGTPGAIEPIKMGAHSIPTLLDDEPDELWYDTTLQYGKRKKGVPTVAIAAIVFVVCLALLAAIGLPAKFTSYTDITSSDYDLRSPHPVYADEMVVADVYGAVGDAAYDSFTSADGLGDIYAIVMYYGADNVWWTTSVRISPDADIYNEVLEYAFDETRVIGDLKLPMALSVDNPSSNMKHYYEAAFTRIYDHFQGKGVTIANGTDESAYYAYDAATPSTARRSAIISYALQSVAIALVLAVLVGLALGWYRKKHR